MLGVRNEVAQCQPKHILLASNPYPRHLPASNTAEANVLRSLKPVDGDALGSVRLKSVSKISILSCTSIKIVTTDALNRPKEQSYMCLLGREAPLNIVGFATDST